VTTEYTDSTCTSESSQDAVGIQRFGTESLQSLMEISTSPTLCSWSTECLRGILEVSPKCQH